MSHVDGDSDTAFVCQLREGRVQQRNDGSIFVWEKAALPALILKPGNSVPPHMSLTPFKMLPRHWSSERASLSKFIWEPFKRNC